MIVAFTSGRGKLFSQFLLYFLNLAICINFVIRIIRTSSCRLFVFIGGFGSILHRVSDVERLFREYNTHMVRVWSPVDLRSFLLPLSLEAKQGVELRASVNRRQLSQKSAQHYETGKRYDRIGLGPT